MKLRLRDHLVYWFHRGLASAGQICVPSLDKIRQEGFQNMLIVATTAIGDAVLCTPLIDSLREAHPDVRIGFWVLKSAVPLFEDQPGLHKVIPYHGKYRRVRETIKALQQDRYDLALVANANDPDIIPMIWWSGCRRILRRPQRNTIYSFMVANPEMLDASHTSVHAIERNLQFCDLLGVPREKTKTRLEIGPDAELRMRQIVGTVPLPCWCVHPGASRPQKQWDVERYAELIHRILRKYPGSVLLTGSVQEKEVCAKLGSIVGKNERVHNLSGRLKLDELAALLKQARLLISGDTGPFHIAMAVDTPTVTLFAPWDIGSSSRINGPYFDLERHRVIETSKLGDPITAIGVDQVFESCVQF